MKIELLLFLPQDIDCDITMHPACNEQVGVLAPPGAWFYLESYTIQHEDTFPDFGPLPALILKDDQGNILGKLNQGQITTQNIQTLVNVLADYQPVGNGNYQNGEGGVINEEQQLQLLPGLGLGLNIQWPIWGKIRSIFIGVAATVLVDNYVKSQSK